MTAPAGIVDALRRRPWLPASLLALALFLQAFRSARQESLTWDEPSYIASGYAYWMWGAFDVNPSHPPLMQMLEALPILPIGLWAPGRDDPEWRNTTNRAVALGKRLVFLGGRDPRVIAFRARLPVMLLGAALVLCVAGWGGALWGTGAGLLAAALVAFDPNLLAHSKVATEDLGCAVFMLAASWALHRAVVESRSWPSWLTCGLLTGLALAAKYTSLLLAPAFLIAAVWCVARAPRGRRLDEFRWLAPRVAALSLVALLVVGLCYRGTFDYAAYLRGLRAIYGDTRPNPTFYFLGQASTEPFPYHALVSLVLKTPLGSLGLLGLAAFGAIRSGRRRGETLVFVLAPALLLIGVSFTDSFNLGVRRILPAVPYLLLFAGRGWADLPRLRWVCGLLLGCTVTAAAAIYPHHLSFFNSIGGGPENAPYLTDDSNVDWGQDLPALAAWQRQNPGAAPLRLSYFGSAVPRAYGVRAEPFDPRDVYAPRHGTYAMSVTNLVAQRKTAFLRGEDMDWLGKYRPVARAGYSILIYRFGPE